MASGLLYLDSSAIVKLVFLEEESAALLAALPRFAGMVSNRLAAVEVRRAVRRAPPDPAALQRSHQVLAGIDLLRLDDAILSSASDLEPPLLRTLDALHLASALSLGDDLSAIAVYDNRLAGAARLNGLEVLSPR